MIIHSNQYRNKLKKDLYKICTNKRTNILCKLNVLMSNFTFALTFFEKTYPILSICVCSLSRLSQINSKIRNICEKNLSVVYANDTGIARCLFD